MLHVGDGDAPIFFWCDDTYSDSSCQRVWFVWSRPHLMDVLHWTYEQCFKRLCLLHEVAWRTHGKKLCYGGINRIPHWIYARLHVDGSQVWDVEEEGINKEVLKGACISIHLGLALWDIAHRYVLINTTTMVV